MDQYDDDDQRLIEDPHEESEEDSDNEPSRVAESQLLPSLPSSDHQPTAATAGAEQHDQHELSFLRLENTLLKKKVEALERGDKRHMKRVVDESAMERIHELLQKAADAKAEAIDYVANTSRDKLGQDVKVLQSILKKAKAERHAFRKKIQAAEDELLQEKLKLEKEEIRFQVDREIFAKMLQDDRDAYRLEVDLLVQKVAELQKDKHELHLWAIEQHEQHLHELRKLTRALARAKKTVDDHKQASEAVLATVRHVEATLLMVEPLPSSSSTTCATGVKVDLRQGNIPR